MLTGLHTNWKYGAYEADRDYLIQLKENDKLLLKGTNTGIHPDADNNPAIGYGYDLNSKSIGTILSDFASVGVVVSGQNETYLRQYKAGTLSKSELIKNSTINISQDQATALLHKIMPTYESQVDRLLGYTMQNSRERASLVSLAYNGALSSSTSLINAIHDDNRAEAWFEIRYRTNAEKLAGVANRRILESDLFGLYDAGNITEASAKEIMRMYTLHKPKISEQEKAYPTAYKQDNNSITNQIKQANQYLQGLYGKGQGGGELEIGGSGVITGAGVADTYEYMDVVLDDTALEGTDHNDIALLGEGNDSFHSSIGDDIIYGGTGVDNLFGDSGDDFLIGNEGTDYLFGGDDNDTLFGIDGYGTSDNREADYLNGGSGYDTYITGAGDTIEDSDGSGRVAFEGGILTGGKAKEGKKGVYEGNGGTYTLSNGTLTFVKGSQALTIQKFKNGDLGITLGEEKPKPKEESPNNNHGSPLVLDLNGDGVTSTFISETSTYFDLDNNGMKERTGWVQSTDGLLALDKNSDGVINDGNELFGNYTKDTLGNYSNNGFDALSKYDTDHDNVIDANDEIYTALQVWQDSNTDGITDAGELHSLSELGVSSINLTYQTTDTLEERNSIRQTSTFIQETTDTEGNTIAETKTVNDVWFDRNLYDTLADSVILSEDIRKMADMQGSGKVKDLSIAMQTDATLKDLVSTLTTTLASISDYRNLYTQVDSILARWTHNETSSGISGTMTSANGYMEVTNQQVAIVSSFNGENFTMTMKGQTISNVEGMIGMSYIRDQYDQIRSTLILSILLKEQFGMDLSQSQQAVEKIFDLNQTGYANNSEKNTVLQISALLMKSGILPMSIEAISTLGYTDKSVIESQLKEFSHSGYYKGTVGLTGDTKLLASAGQLYGSGGDDLLVGSEGKDNLYGGEGYDILRGGGSNDYLDGGWGSDILDGEAGNDTLIGGNGWGNDYLRGGEGDDYLDGSGGDDTYYYRYGDGNDIINRTPGGGSVAYTDYIAQDRLILENILSSDVSFEKSGEDLVVLIKDIIDENSTNGSIRIKNWFNSISPMRIFEFGDGSRYEIQDIVDILNKAYQNTINWGNFKGSSSISGDDNANTLIGGNSSDVLEGGQGDDYLQGQGGNDRYIFNRGDQHDTIFDTNFATNSGGWNEYDGGNDTLVFGVGITLDDLLIHFSGENVVIGLNEENVAFDSLSDTITIVNGIKLKNKIETVRFADGTLISYDELIARAPIVGQNLLVGTSGNDVLNGTASEELYQGGAGDDTYVYSLSGNRDTIYDNYEYATLQKSYIQSSGGIDTLSFTEEITKNDLIVKVLTNSDDLIVAIKEDGKAFTELSDKIILKDWFNINNRIEMFRFSDGTIWDTNAILAHQGTDEADITRLLDMTSSVRVSLDDGDDVVITGRGNDTLIGGTGNDILQGGVGNDIYLFNNGDGADTIIDTSGNDTLQFIDGITANDIVSKASANSNDLIVGVKEDGVAFDELSDKITLKNWFDPKNRIENFVFSDGIVWSVNDIVATQVTEGDDIIRPVDMTQLTNIHLLGGDDYITTGTANDNLIGGTGNDTLQGGGGNDTYVFNLGDGIDTITDVESYQPYYSSTYTQLRNGGDDTIRFGDDITADDLIIKASADSSDLIVALKEDGVAFSELTDKITLKNWFDSKYRIESFTFSDDTVWDVNDIVNAQGTEDADTVHLVDSISDVTLNLKGGNDTLITANGNDTLIGGTGNDTLQGNGGNDTYVFAQGSGIDTIIDTAGDDTLRFIDGITADDIIIKASVNSNDLIVALKEDGKTFDQLSDKITLKNWFNVDNRIENIVFSDGTVWNINDIVNAQGTEDADTVHLLDTITDVVLDLKGGNDSVVTGSGNDTITGGKGNDLLKGGEGNDTYIFNRGDSNDTIIDVSGLDTLSFGSGITENDIVVVADEESDDLIVALKEDGVSFEDLSDKIILKNWYIDGNRIESFSFSNGTVLDTLAITQLQTTDMNDNYLRYLDHDNTIDALEGDDTIHGGAGDDTYVFNRGDGIDHIIDIVGMDTLKFGIGITQEDIEVHADNNYLIIGLKENGVSFEELSDKVYFKRVGLDDYGIENLTFDDENSIDPRSLISTYDGTDGNDTINLTYLQSINPTVSIDDSLVINAKAGNDTIAVGNGSNTIDMGTGYMEYLTVGNGDNQIDMGTGWGKRLNAGDGDNIISASTINMTMGNGNNTLLTPVDSNYSYSDITAHFGEGDNTITSISQYQIRMNADFGNGDNTILLDNNDISYSFYGGSNIDVNFGNGNNTIQIGQKSSSEVEDDLYRYGAISVGDGNNKISVKNGDGILEIETGTGYNIIEFSADVDQVYINYAGEDQYIGNSNGNNTITQLADTDIEYSYYSEEELITESYANEMHLGLGNGDNVITLTNVAQDYTLQLGDGANTILIGKEDSDNDYAMNSLIEIGDGNNTLNVLSGDGSLEMTLGIGKNSITFNADLDDVLIEAGDGNNTIVQLGGIDTDGDSVNDSRDVRVAAAYVYYGGEGDYYYGNENIHNDNVSLLLGNGNNNVTISRTDMLEGVFGEGDNTIRLGDVKRSYLEFDGGENRIAINTTDSSYVDIANAEKSTITMGSGSTLLTARYTDENIISTGAGADDIYTYESDDTYIVNIGDGSDAILDMHGTDKITFGEGITKENLKVRVEFYSELMIHADNAALIQQFQYDANADGFSYDQLMNANLVIHYSDNPEDVLILVNWYDMDSRIEQFEFADGTILSDHQIVSLIGTDEDDIVLGTEGDNTLRGGEGEDEIDGGEGNDTYLYNRGDSHDLFSEEGGFDTIAFGEGITKDDLILQKTDNNLLVSLKEPGNTQTDLSDTITVSNWFDESGRIERFRFADGSTMELNEILSRVDVDGVIYYGTPDTDAMEGTDIGDIIMARESDDIINGNDGNDLLFGEAGDDTLRGGVGDDQLYGGEGNDIYIIDRNMGNDIVVDQKGTDILRFSEGITSDNIEIWYNNNDLKIGLEGSEITLSDWYSAENRIEIFTFTDGTILDVNAIINLQYEEVKGVLEGTTFDVDNGDETIYQGQSGNDVYRIGTYADTNTIVDAGGVDRIEFEEGIAADMVDLSYEGDDLIISLEGTAVRIEGWYTTQNRIEMFAFEDGTVLSPQEIIDLMATDGDDSIRSLEEGSIIDAGEGNDLLKGGNSRDTLLGGSGSDVYRFGYGSGHDVIIDAGGDISEIDSIVFDQEVDSNNVLFKWEQSTDNLIVYLKNPNQPTDILDAIADRIIIQNWYQTNSRIETFLFADGTMIDSQGVIDRLVSDQNDLIRGIDNEDTVINALNGDDEIYTFEGNDILSGGKGNDLLAGQQGDDTYVFHRGDGIDTIIDRATHVWDDRNEENSGNDQIRFGEGILLSHLAVAWDKNTNDLIIGVIDPENPNVSFDEMKDKVIIREWFNPSSRIEIISFADGTQIGIQEIYNLLATDGDDYIRALDEGGTLNGYKGNDRLEGSIGDDILDGAQGNDTLSGHHGNDILIGGEGDDILLGDEGDDILDGGTGNNRLEGGSGNDSYIFGYGLGKTTVYDNAYLLDSNSSRENDYIAIDGGTDTIYFGEGITADDLIVKNDGFDLVITLKDSPDDMMRIQDYYKPFNTIEFFGFSDETIMSGAEFESLLFTPGDDNVTFVDDQDRVLNGDNGNDIINGGNGNDIIDGAGGDDTLNGGFGDDVYLFGRGSGHDTIPDSGIGEWWKTRSGNDTVFLKEGIDRDDLWVKEDGNDLLIAIREEGKGFEELSDTLRIAGALDDNNPFESVMFANRANASIVSLLNHLPEAPSETSHTLQDIRILTGEVGATDIDGDILTYAVSAQATHGTFSVDTNGVWSYSAADGYMGEDSAIVTIDDNNGGIITQTLSFDVKVSAPTLSDSTSGLLEDTPISGALSVVNPIGGTLVYEILKSSMKGTFDIDAQGNWSYDPALNVNGDDSVTIKVTNEYGLSSTATLNLAIEAVNDAPVAISEEAFVLQDIRVQSGTVEATDVENDILTYTVSTAAEHGTLSVNEAGEWSYNAAEGYMGTDSAIITIDDSNGGVISQTLSFEVKVSAPTLSNTTSGLLEDTSTNGVFNVTNPIGGALVYEVLNASAKGAFSVNEAGEWNYTPNADLNGEDSVTLRVTNAYGLSTTATLNLAIEAVNDIPVVTASITLNAVAEDSGVIIITQEQLLASSYDVDGDLLNVSNLSASAGTLVDNLNGTWSLTPDLDYNGTITLDYTVTDGQAYAAATTMQVVTALNDAPILIETPLPITLDAGTSTTGSIKASDVDGDVLSYRITSTPVHGELSINENGEWSYNAERYYAGESNATVSIDDGHGESITTTLNFTNLMTPDWHYTYGGETLTINDNDGEDILMMNDISMSDLTFLQEGNNLRIDVKDKNDVILTDYFTSPTKGIESIQTAQGAINLSKERIGSSGSFFGIKWGSDNNDLISGSDNRNNILFGHNGNDILFGKGYSDLLYGNGGNDLLIGGEGNDTLSGESGDDILYGDNGNDTLCGDEGNDKLFGGKGNDMLEGGAGNDLLYGGEGTNTLIGSTGNDTYLVTNGSNNTTIHENILGFNFFGHYIGQNGGNDTLLFGEGITKEDISFLMRGNDLLLQYGDNEFITINNQKNEANRIEKLQLDDGSYLTNSDMDQIIQQLSAYSKDHGFHLKDNTQIQNNQAMMNIVAAGWHTL